MSRLVVGVALLAAILVLAGAAHSAAAQGIEFGPPTESAKPLAKKKPTTQQILPGVGLAPAPIVRPEVVPQGTALPAATVTKPQEWDPQAATPEPEIPPAPAAAIKSKTVHSTSGLPPPPKPRTCKNTGNFDTWLSAFKKDAAAQGVSQNTIQSALGGIGLDPGVISRDRRQGIFSISFLDFSSKLATIPRLQRSKAQVKKNAQAFERANTQFGVPASVIAGFWALESDFGTGMGDLPILKSLATLAYDCRRDVMFRAELMAALQIIDRGDMDPAEMIGSWAGEIGQTQFLPTRYLEHAMDYDGDGKANLYRNPTDIIGSTANYMTHLGWRRDEPWLEEVRLTSDLPWEKADLAIKLPRSQWAQWGVTRVDGSALDTDALPASLLLPMGRNGPAFLAYVNFNVYTQWNQSLNYAITAAYLATRIDGAPAMSKLRKAVPVLSAEEAKDLQRLLVRRGFDVGEVDGKIGANTRAAVKAVQLKLGFPPDSYPTPELLSAMRSNS